MKLTAPEFSLQYPYGIDKDTWRDIGIGTGVAGGLIFLRSLAPTFTLGMPVAIGDTQTFIINVGMASFGEEILFRGALPFLTMKLFYLAQLYNLGSNFWIVNSIQSVLFGIFHANAYNLNAQGNGGSAFVGATSIGFLFGLVVAITHSLVSVVIPHAGLNADNYFVRSQSFQVASLGGM